MPRNQPPTDGRTGRIKQGLLVALAVLSIAGCAEGTSRDAERGREQDADRTSVVDDLQSTRTTEIIKGTPNASPTAPP